MPREIHRVTPERLAEILGQYGEFENYEIGEDNEGQLVIYTGLYRDPSEHQTQVWTNDPLDVPA